MSQNFSDSEIFYDAEDTVADDSIIPPSDAEKDPSPPQSQDFSKQRCLCVKTFFYFYCPWCSNLPRRFPRTIALVFRVFLPLYSLILIAMVFGYFLCRLEAPGEKHANNMALAANNLVDQMERLNEMTLTVVPLICFERYIKRINGTQTFQDPLEEYINKLFIENGYDVVQQLLEHDFTMPNISVSNLTELRLFTAECGIKMNEMVNQFREQAYNDASISDYIGNEVTFNWIKCPVDKNKSLTDVDLTDVDLTDLVSETFVVYEAGAQLEYVTQRWESDLSKTYDDYFAQYRNTTNMTPLEVRAKTIRDAYNNADGFDACVEDVLSAAWWSL
jgi:hypothetical protein